MIKYSYCLFLLALIGCNSEKKDLTTIFAGEIVNPTGESVILYKDDVVIDSAQLDMYNRFSIKLNNLEEGLYNFHNSGQYQYVYLTQGDSLLIRLNRIYFDESLVFSGRGEELNNFLIEVFLDNEEEESLIDTYYNLKPEEFTRKVDSLRQNKIVLLEELKSEIDLSPKSLTLAHASIDYGSYISKEKYPFKYLRKNPDGTLPKVSEQFYNYRKNLDFDDKDLTFFTPYYDFMKRHFDNLAFNDCAVDCNGGKTHIKDQLHFNRHKLQLIDSIVKEKQLRDNLFRNVAMTYFLKVHDSVPNNKIFLEDFHKLSNNNRHIEEIHELYEAVNNLQPGQQIPDIAVLDSLGNTISLREISKVKKNVVFFFWTDANTRHFTNISKQIEKLKMLHPDYTFVGLSLSGKDENWKNVIKSNKQSFDNQFRAKDSYELRRSLIVDGLNKAVLIKDGLIVNAYKDIYSLN
ncbi:thioredoxin-like domain-containing protein [Cellulophaga tyrosinoxydans]|uniref:AhpC/TSA family protein n=1 Tax=Cellulophaga tyrosinoxydans TaxID=504486 RepID=A0A1W1ZQX1_9FLAO|nr:thioredoxin-like domain-containing protein [Cellulophaga tyrosinoxydans]SMC50461.1 AhpC/TSA family protein [Cellulophaga tyrosinoxydans]